MGIRVDAWWMDGKIDDAALALAGVRDSVREKRVVALETNARALIAAGRSILRAAETSDMCRGW